MQHKCSCYQFKKQKPKTCIVIYLISKCIKLLPSMIRQYGFLVLTEKNLENGTETYRLGKNLIKNVQGG